MTTAYTPILQLALPVTGELDGTWGTVVNDNITSMIEQAIAGLATINTWTTASHTLTTADGTTDEARCAVLECSGAPGAAATVICPASTKLYVIKNSVTGGYAVTLKTSAGTGISVPNGSTALLYCDGTNVVSGATYMATVSTTQVDILAQGDLRLQDTTGGEYVAIQAPATLAASYTLTMPVDDGTAGQALVTDGSGVLSWSTAASGDVYGPASATDNAVARFDATTGKLIQNSVVTIADTTGNMAGVGTLSSGAITSSALTSGRVPYAGTAGLIQDSANLTFNGTTLTNTGNAVISDNSANAALRITQIGAGNAILVEDSANPDATPFVVDSDGRVGMGATPSAAVPVNISYNLTGGTSVVTVRAIASILSDVTTSATVFRSQPFVQAAAFTLSSLVHYNALQGTFGATSTVTNQYGFFADAGLTGATNNYGFLGNIPSSTGRWNFYASGTADNYFAGNVGVGTTTPAAKLHVSGSTKTGGILVEDSSASAAAPAIEVIGKRSDANAFPVFAGKLLLARNRTDAAISNNITLGSVAFGGNHTDGTLANILYPASIVGLSTGAFSSATAMPTSLLFQTGSTGVAPDTLGVTIGTERMRVSDTGVITLGAAVGSESLRVTPTASAVNYLDVTGAITTASPSIAAAGSDTNIGITLTPKGTSAVNLNGRVTTGTGVGAGSSATQITIGGTLVSASNVTRAVSNIGTAPSTSTTEFSSFISAPSTTAAAYTITTLNHFIASFATLGATSAITNQFGHVAASTLTNATNNYGFYGNIASGTGRYNFYANGTAANVFAGTTSLGGLVGAESLRATPVASAVNYIEAQGQITTGGPSLIATGSDTNVPLLLKTKGTGSFNFYTSGATLQFLVGHVASAVNYLQVVGGATGGSPIFSAQGSDTNIDIALTPKGTGVLRFGTYTAGILAQAGYITIKDAAGNTRNLLVG